MSQRFKSFSATAQYIRKIWKLIWNKCETFAFLLRIPAIRFSRICYTATHINEEIVVNCHMSHAIVVNHERSTVCRWLASTKLGENLTSAKAKKISPWHAIATVSLHYSKCLLEIIKCPYKNLPNLRIILIPRQRYKSNMNTLHVHLIN